MSRKPQVGEDEDGKIRLDKWLWAARFFKTRQLAHEAIELGRVLVGSERVKPSRTVNVGDTLHLRINQLEYHVTVIGLSTQRKSAKDAQSLYSESAESQAAREERAALIRAERASFPHGEGRPTKRARRDMLRFKDTFQ
ncbi:RNA-binding S4 domain-containing protein [Paludibacterium purpuratum]|uniref:Heat shock protein Hsp15 n=1 Tax=Paludibacterium purpuratum TaxID=1144873 RepID=A0A4V3DVT3_9NEIS|nr:S4 domain-containing protein [Paludibacterium purpuratum]TDR82109.1 heat shock protein Hsp15 [Paludibacterium purpuratum]